MKSKQNILALLTCSILSACSFSGMSAPNITAQNWTVQSNPSDIESNMPFLYWWKGYDDEMLNSLVESALANNNKLNMSRGHIAAAQGELKKVQFQWIPDITAVVGYSNNPATGFPGLLAVLAPNFTLNIFKQFKEQKRAKYELAAAKAEDDAIRLEVIKQITAAYFTYLAEVEHKQLLDNLANDISQIEVISQKIYKGGLNNNITLSEMNSQVSLIRGEQEIVEQNIIVSRNVISYLINNTPRDLETNTKFINLDNKTLIPGQLPMTVLENRPDMQMAKNELEASNEGIGISASNLLPTLQLDFIGGPVAGNNSYNFPTPLMKNAVDFNDELLQIPLLRASTLGEIDKAKGLNQISYYKYIDTLQKALRDSTNALSANFRFTNKFYRTESAMKSINKKYDLQYSLYNKGIISKLDTLQTKLELDRIKITLNQDKLQQMITTVNLYYELAGGYKEESVVQNTPKS
jgi:outer membrane protein TolC